MTTKVRNLRQSLEFGGNFEHDPATTTGLEFGHSAGTVHNSGKLESFAAGTVTVPAGTSIVYADVEPDEATLEADATITSTRYVPLYEVVASGGAITSVTDLRGLLMTSIGSDLGTAPTPPTLSALITTLAPVHWWKHDEASGDLLDTGSDGTWDMSLSGTDVTRELAGPDGTDKAYQWYDNATGFMRTTGETFGTSSGTGAVVCFYQKIATHAFSTNDFLYLANSTTNFNNSMTFGFGTLGINTAAKLGFIVVGSSISNRREFEITDTLGDTDTNWYCVIINKGASGAPLMYLNGTNYALTETTNGTPPADDTWFDDFAFTTGAVANGLYGSASTNWNQALSHTFIMDRALTSGEIASLSAFAT